MKNLKLALLGMFVSFGSFAQINTPAPSPTATLTQEVGLTTITINYSRPSIKGRTIFGDLVKYDELWRTGANAATKLSFSGDVNLAGNSLKAGDYVILTVPGKSEWKLNIYNHEGNGVGAYFSKEPIATSTVTASNLSETTESFTIDINNLRNNSATIDLIWENTKVSIPLAVDADASVMAQINKYEESSKAQRANDYNSAASYLLSEKKELEKALDFSTKAVALRPDAYWMSRTKSLIEAELGKYKDAIKSAEMSLAAAEKAENGTYISFNKASIAEWKKKK
ncbi:MAG: DUF2911 domain-containing protein [Cyclobacteriaceae bacterium]